MKYQVINTNCDTTIPFNAPNWAVVDTRTDKIVKDNMKKQDALSYAKQLNR